MALQLDQLSSFCSIKALSIASWSTKAKSLQADVCDRNNDVGLKDSPIFAVADCQELLPMLRTRSRCGFATLSTSAISLRGLAYFARYRAEWLIGKPVVLRCTAV